MSTLVEPNEVIDCSNPKLDLYTHLSGVLTDVAELEFAIFDISIPATPVQTYPVAGFQVLDPANLCPIGHKLSTGRYTAEWTVPAAEPLTNHKITWRFRLTLGGAQQEFEQPFNVVTVSGGPDPIDVAAFRVRFPDFADVVQFPAELITEVLSEATDDLDEDCFGATKIQRARQYYAAHLLAYNTGGARAKGATSVTAGSASISWDAAKQNFEATAYGQRFRFMARMCAGGMVLC